MNTTRALNEVEKIYLIGWYEYDEHVKEQIFNVYYVTRDFTKALYNLPSDSSIVEYCTDIVLDEDTQNKNVIHRYGNNLIGEGKFRYISGDYTVVMQSLEQDNL